MPIVQIHLPKNCADEATLERIRVACRQHVLDTLSADRAHHDYVTVVEVLGKMGDGVPLVKVDQRPGREKWRKEQFSQRIAKTIADELKCQENHCFVVFRESPTEHNFYVGDGFLTPFNPAAHAKSKL
ncbi:Tautomerase domain-containing protein [Durusdinium trenchii]